MAPLTTKFVRYMQFTQQFNMTATPPIYGGAVASYFKILYEFWGFCVNGGSSLTTPGGFAAINGVSLPTSLQSGITLIASGSDGSTQLGSSYFSASNIPLTSSAIAPSDIFLVTWKSGSSSTDDSIYRVLQKIDSGTLLVDVQSGGTPQTGSLIPSFTTRNSINWRLINLNQTIGNAFFNMSGSAQLVLQFNGAPYVNLNQANSQIRIRALVGSVDYGGGNRDIDIYWSISPSGSWDGTSFSDAGAEIVSNPHNMTIGGNSGGQPVTISLWGAQDFLHITTAPGIFSGRPPLFGSASRLGAIHIEIPQRLYPQINDPNPITFATTQAQGGYLFTIDGSDSTVFYGMNAWYMLDNNNVTRKFILTTKSWCSPNVPGTLVTVPHGGTLASLLATPIAYNQFLNKHLVSDGILSCPLTPGFFCLARARLRRIKFMPQTLPILTKIGADGSQLLMQNGVLLPWDNALLSNVMFPYGLGLTA